jgi:large subunit ribosomal protein L31
MKSSVHPNYNTKAKIVCISCGTTYYVGSTRDDVSVELCSNCHPFYTGKLDQQLVDTENRVKLFRERSAVANADLVVKKRAKIQVRKAKVTSIGDGPKLTLKDMLKQIKQ